MQARGVGARLTAAKVVGGSAIRGWRLYCFAVRFIFLGTGTSAGVPVIGCDCPACQSDDPRDRRTRTGAAVIWTDAQGQERVVLLDATPDLRAQALREGVTRCDAILFTHNHVDHIFGLDEVRRFNAVMDAPIDIYAEARTLASLRRVYQHIFEPERNVNQSFIARLIAHEMPADLPPIELFGVRFTPIRLLHGRLPILGFRIESASSAASARFLPLAYCTDVSGVPTESWRRLEGVATLALDALRPRRHPTHLTLDQAVEIAQRVGAERTFLVHMAHQLKHAETEAILPPEIRLAYDGLALE